MAVVAISLLGLVIEIMKFRIASGYWSTNVTSSSIDGLSITSVKANVTQQQLSVLAKSVAFLPAELNHQQ